MAIGLGSTIEIALRYLWLGQQCQNTYQYAVAELSTLPSAANFGEAWWNHVKATQRAMVRSAMGDVFYSVLVTELGNPEGDYGEFDVPLAERPGTRSGGSSATAMPSFTAIGVRLTVGSRLTRPGQKRYPFLDEADVNVQQVDATTKALVVSAVNVACAPIILGAPAALATLNPVVVRKGPSSTILASQSITGNVVNNYLTTQVSRKVFRGV